MHELYLLKEVVERELLSARFVLAAEDKHPDDFGGYVALYSSGSHHIRFVWDGKGGCGYLEHSQQSRDWQRIGKEIPEGNPDSMRTAAAAEWPAVLAEAIK